MRFLVIAIIDPPLTVLPVPIVIQFYLLTKKHWHTQAELMLLFSLFRYRI